MPVEDEEDSDADDEHVEGEGVERVKLPKEGDIVKKMKDPILPTPEEVDRHYVMGHLPYRSWCPICVGAQGRESAHRRDDKGDHCMPEYAFDLLSGGMFLGINGRYW